MSWRPGLKTDASAEGPRPGTPIRVASGMLGDWAFVVFTSPEEMGKVIQRQCE